MYVCSAENIGTEIVSVAPPRLRPRFETEAIGANRDEQNYFRDNLINRMEIALLECCENEVEDNYFLRYKWRIPYFHKYLRKLRNNLTNLTSKCTNNETLSSKNPALAREALY